MARRPSAADLFAQKQAKQKKVLFLLVPAFSVFRNALRTEDGYSFSAMKEAMSGQNQEAFWRSKHGQRVDVLSLHA